MVTYTNSYGALQIGYGGSSAPNVTTLGLKSIKFFVYAGAGVKTSLEDLLKLGWTPVLMLVGETVFIASFVLVVVLLGGIGLH